MFVYGTAAQKVGQLTYMKTRKNVDWVDEGLGFLKP